MLFNHIKITQIHRAKIRSRTIEVTIPNETKVSFVAKSVEDAVVILCKNFLKRENMPSINLPSQENTTEYAELMREVQKQFEKVPPGSVSKPTEAGDLKYETLKISGEYAEPIN